MVMDAARQRNKSRKKREWVTEKVEWRRGEIKYEGDDMRRVVVGVK